MNIIYDKEIYIADFDPQNIIYDTCNKHQSLPHDVSCDTGRRKQLNMLFLHETTKVVEIYDNNNALHYKVALLTKDNGIFSIDASKMLPDKFYVVCIDFNDLKNPEFLFRSDPIDTYTAAKDLFIATLRVYCKLIESPIVQDIAQYADKIGYHEIDTCCKRCKWSNCLSGEYICRNYALFAPTKHELRSDTTLPERILDPGLSANCIINLDPKVDPTGVCKYFAKSSR